MSSPKDRFSLARELVRGKPVFAIGDQIPRITYVMALYVCKLGLAGGRVSISTLTRRSVGGNVLMFHVKHGHPTMEFNSEFWSSVNALCSP